MVTLGSERFRCPEALFQPSLLDDGGSAGGARARDGVADIVVKAIQACDKRCHPEYYENVVLAGGSTLFPGFADRLAKDIAARAPAPFDALVHVVDDKTRAHSAWIGGAMMALCDGIDSICIKPADYHARGPAIAHEKCR